MNKFASTYKGDQICYHHCLICVLRSSHLLGFVAPSELALRHGGCDASCHGGAGLVPFHACESAQSVDSGTPLHAASCVCAISA